MNRICASSIIAGLALTICGAVNQTANAQERGLTVIQTPLQPTPYTPGNRQATPGVVGNRLTNQARSLNNIAKRANDPCRRGQQNFVEAAMWFDLDGDRRLAMHETQNLLQTIGRQQTNQARSFSSTGPVDARVADEQLFQFVTIFGQLALQHDGNRDGFMDEGELSRFAGQLIQFAPNLAGAACAQSRAVPAQRVQTIQPQQQLSNFSQRQQTNPNAYQGFNLDPAQSCPAPGTPNGQIIQPSLQLGQPQLNPVITAPPTTTGTQPQVQQPVIQSPLQ